MYNETIQPPEANAQYLGWGPSLLGAEFVRCRVCQGPSLSRAEMSRNLFLESFSALNVFAKCIYQIALTLSADVFYNSN